MRQLLPQFETKRDALKRRSNMIMAFRDYVGTPKPIVQYCGPFMGMPELHDHIIAKALGDDRRTMKLRIAWGNVSKAAHAIYSSAGFCVKGIALGMNPGFT